jgi:hypothetical protein
MKGRPMMQFSAEYAATSLPVDAERAGFSRRPSDYAYRAVTALAMLLLLGTLWVF